MSDITFDRDAMLAAVKTVAGVVQRTITIAVLGNVLIETRDGTATITASDLDLVCEARCPASGNVRITAPAAIFEGALAGLRGGEVKMTVADGKAVLAQGRSRRTLPTIPADDFPVFQIDDDRAAFEVGAASLARLLGSVAHAQGNNIASPYLCGVYLHRLPAGVAAVATNAQTLAVARLNLPDAPQFGGTIIATRTVALLMRLLGKGEGAARVEIGQRKLAVTIGSVRVLAKVIEGTFPDYERIIPQPRDGALAVQSVELLRAVAAAGSGINTGKARAIKFALDAGEALQLEARDGEGAVAVEPLDGEFAGTARAVGIDVKYITAVGRMFAETSDLTLDFGDPKAAVRIESRAEPDLLAVVGTMHV